MLSETQSGDLALRAFLYYAGGRVRMDDCASAFRIRQRSLKDCTDLLLVQISKSSGSHPGQVCYLILIIGIAQNLRLIAYEGFCGFLVILQMPHEPGQNIAIGFV